MCWKRAVDNWVVSRVWLVSQNVLSWESSELESLEGNPSLDAYGRQRKISTTAETLLHSGGHYVK